MKPSDELNSTLTKHLEPLFLRNVQDRPSDYLELKIPLIAEFFVQAFARPQGSFIFGSRKSDLELLDHADDLFTELLLFKDEMSSPLHMALTEMDMRKRGRGRHFTDSFDFFESIEAVRHDVRILARMVRRYSSDKRVNWKAASIAGWATEVWEHVGGKRPPVSVHADVPGPFGRFVQDILELLYSEYASDENVPSARSATRALQNVTSSGAKYHPRW